MSKVPVLGKPSIFNTLQTKWRNQLIYKKTQSCALTCSEIWWWSGYNDKNWWNQNLIYSSSYNHTSFGNPKTIFTVQYFSLIACV